MSSASLASQGKLERAAGKELSDQRLALSLPLTSGEERCAPSLGASWFTYQFGRKIATEVARTIVRYGTRLLLLRRRALDRLAMTVGAHLRPGLDLQRGFD
jgi:hypothetical protein